MAKKIAAQKSAKRPSLLDLAKSASPPSRSNFTDRLPPDVRDELLELRRAFQANELPAHMTATRIYREVVSPAHPDICGIDTFRRWLGVAEHG